MTSWAAVAATLLVAVVPFDSYPGEARLIGNPVAPLLDTPRARRHQTVLTAGARRGTNFNGHYRVIKWGCGTNCIEWAVVDLSNGKVWFAPEPALSCFPLSEPDDAKMPDWFEIRVNSRLLGLNDCIGKSQRRPFNRRTLYEWQNGTMRLAVTKATGS
jgi:hypothetical protein